MGITGPKSNKKQGTGVFSDWLETLQQESWQLELLISGFALFGVWESKKMINALDIFNTLNVSSGSLDFLLSLLVFLLNIGWFIFLINLLMHIILRGFWIGAIGLRYVSGEIDYEELGYSEYFTNYLRKKVGSYDDFIERLERLCSIIFAFTFLLFFLFISILLYLAGFVLITYIGEKLSGSSLAGNTSPPLLSMTLIMIYLGLGIIMLIDFLSFGAFKKMNPGFAEKAFSFVFKFMSLITLSFLYRPLLYNFLDDKYTRRLLLLSIPYFIILIFVVPLIKIQSYPYFPKFLHKSNGEATNISENSVQWFFYDDLREKHREQNNSIFNKKQIIKFASLSNFTITEDYASLFLRQLSGDAKKLEVNPEASALYKKGVRHLFFGVTAKDSIFTALNKELHAKYKQELNYKKKNPDIIDANRWEIMNDSIIHHNNAIRELYHRQKINKNLNSFRSLYDVNIDGINYIDSMTCQFYVHPNAEEKGLICFFPTKSLKQGPHKLRISKMHTNQKNELIDSTVRYIPFMKL